MKQIVKAAFLITVFSVATRAVGFLYRIFLSRALGAEGMGILQVALSAFGVLVTFTSSGLPVTVSRLTARVGRQNFAERDRLVTAAALLGLIVSGLLALLLFLLREQLGFLFSDGRCLPVFLTLLPAFLASSLYSACRGGLWGNKSFLSYSLVEFCEEAAMVAAGVIFLQGVDLIADKTLSAARAVTISYLTAALLTIFLYLKKGKFRRCGKQQIVPLLQGATPITAVRLLGCLLGSAVAILLPQRLTAAGMTPAEALSLFGVMSGMVMPLLFLPGTVTGSVALVLVPEVSATSQKRDKAALNEHLSNSLNFSLLITCIVLCGYLSCGQAFASALYENPTAGKLLVVSAALMIPMTLSQLSSTIMNSLGLESKVMRHFALGALLMLGSVLFLPSLIGIYAITVGNLLQLTLSAVLNLRVIRKQSGLPLSFLKQGFRCLLLGIPAGCLGRMFGQLLSHFLPALIASGLGLGVALGSLTLLCCLFGLLDLKAFLLRPAKNSPPDSSGQPVSAQKPLYPSKESSLPSAPAPSSPLACRVHKG